MEEILITEGIIQDLHIGTVHCFGFMFPSQLDMLYKKWRKTPRLSVLELFKLAVQWSQVNGLRSGSFERFAISSSDDRNEPLVLRADLPIFRRHHFKVVDSLHLKLWMGNESHAGNYRYTSQQCSDSEPGDCMMAIAGQQHPLAGWLGPVFRTRATGRQPSVHERMIEGQ